MSAHKMGSKIYPIHLIELNNVHCIEKGCKRLIKPIRVEIFYESQNNCLTWNSYVSNKELVSFSLGMLTILRGRFSVSLLNLGIKKLLSSIKVHERNKLICKSHKILKEIQK